MSLGGYVAVLASSLSAPAGYTIIKLATELERSNPRKSYAVLLHLGRFTVAVVYPTLMVVAYLYGERFLVPVSHAAGIVWHTLLAWVFLPEGAQYGWSAVAGMTLFSIGVADIVYVSSELNKRTADDGDWGRLTAWVVASQCVLLLGIFLTRWFERSWFVVCAMFKSTEVLISAGAWNLVHTDGYAPVGLAFLFAVPVVCSGIATVLLTEKLVTKYSIYQVMPSLTALFVVVGVCGDLVFYGRWVDWSFSDGLYLSGGLILVLAGILLFKY